MGQQQVGLWQGSVTAGSSAAAVVLPCYVLLAEVVPPLVSKQGTADGVPLATLDLQ